MDAVSTGNRKWSLGTSPSFVSGRLALSSGLRLPFNQSDALAWRFPFALWRLLPGARIGAKTLAKRLAEALETSRKNGLAGYTSLQPHYNLVERQPFETELIPVTEQFQLGVIPHFSLAAGFLTGKYRSEKDAENTARGAMVKKYLNELGIWSRCSAG